MLTGRKVFEGELVSDVIASVIKNEPKWSLLPHSGGGLRKLLTRCLEKDPKQRLRDIGDARVEIEEGARAPRDVGDDKDLLSRRRALTLAAMGSLVVAVVTGALVSRRAASPELSGDVTRFQIEVSGIGGLALSPDGRTLARPPAQGVHVRSFDSWESPELQAVIKQRARSPFFSPVVNWSAELEARVRR